MGALVVLVAVQLSVLGLYLPPVFESRQKALHPRRSFHCRSRLPCDRIGQWARWSCWWLSSYPCWDCISRRCSNMQEPSHSTPDDHFTAGPDCRVNASASGRVDGAGSCPTIRAGIVSPASVQKNSQAILRPKRSFHCRSTLPCDHIEQRARWSCWWQSNCPCWDCISRRYSKSRATIISAPNDHLTAGPHCCVNSRAVGALVVLVAVQLSVLG